ncbi:unnamed protein product [Rotaria sordida]|uniref:Uncharacterized protein n=1 Tax=Rotaria sordida TaxID=392033 RepID=A0A814RIT7_9BILA|nr:unnamed protein product [Rotaria sordida]CAF1356906.1 unnamed protein product [Rotaria sordida]
MASKCRMFKVNISNIINVELIAKSECNCERMAELMASVEGKRTNDIAQLGVDLTLKRCQWLIEYIRHEFANLHHEFNDRLYVLSKEINIDVIDAKLQTEDIRVQDGLHPTLSSGRQKFENVQQQWFAQQAMHVSKTTVQQLQQQQQHNRRTIITTTII